MTPQQTLVVVLYVTLVILSVREYWKPQLSAIVG